jgi:hypothetical protein
MEDTLPLRTVRIGWARVCPVGRVGGQTTQSGSTRTPCPAVAIVGSTGSGLTPRIYLGGGAGDADHSIMGETDSESPEARGTALSWRHPTSTSL